VAIERNDPPITGGEKETLEAFLDYHRRTLLMKVEGIGDDELRRPMVPSGTSLLGMVKHLAYVERWWFGHCFAGADVTFPWSDDDPDADWRVEADETTSAITALYDSECARGRSIVAEVDDLDRRAARAVGRRQEQPSLRWILIHMIEETARHNGHADILREMIDGTTGE